MQTERLIEKIKSLPIEKIAAIEAFVDTIAEDENKQNEEDDLYKAIAVYAAEVGGTEHDLDPAFETAAVEHLLKLEEVENEAR